MSQVVEQLADLTGHRDRDVLDVTLVAALRDLLRPLCVAIHRGVGEGDQPQRWITRARLTPSDTAATADALYTELALLPALDAFPDRLACMQQQQMLMRPPAEGGTPALTYFPLAGERADVGVLEVESVQPLSAEDLRLISSILRIYANFQSLLDYSERDTLTGLLNRKTFDETFLRVMVEEAQAELLPAGSEARRQLPPGHGWLGVIDIDHFKQVNDNCGHLIGDEVLLLLSRLMRSSFRFHDRLYRFGGEEFVVLMRCGNAADAGSAMQRLRTNVERYVFPQVGCITVSVGFTEVRPGDTPNGAFERADKAVYWAKQNGRNQVAHFADLVAAGKLADTARDSDVELF